MNSKSEKDFAKQLSQDISKDEAPPEKSMQQGLDGLQKMMGGGEQSQKNQAGKEDALQELIKLIIKLIKMMLGLKDEDDNPQLSRGSGKPEINPEMLKQAKQFLDENPLLKKIGQKVVNKLHEKGYLDDKQFEAINKELFSPKAEPKPLSSPVDPLHKDASVRPKDTGDKPDSSPAAEAGPKPL